MTELSDFLFDKILAYDLVLVDVTEAPEPQVLRARVRRVYSSGKGIDSNFLDLEIEFVQAGRAWGNMILDVGDHAFLFVRRLASGLLHENFWHGHMIVEEIEGDLYAIFQHKEMWLNKNIPPLLRENSRPDPKRSHTTAVRFDVVESYLLSLIEKAGR
ncbi:hypothetical protein AB3464_03155 [Pseudomonas asplenii]|uniref:hypothetical protein n=1 Tax=Pseudomonas asplenii TaxID=53407 RepID=UPI0037C748E6